MKSLAGKISNHAAKRMQQRSIPPGIVDLILDFGDAMPTRGGATSHALTKDSFRQLKRWLGPDVSGALSRYRNAYVVADGSSVITAAFASKPRHH